MYPMSIVGGVRTAGAVSGLAAVGGSVALWVALGLVALVVLGLLLRTSRRGSRVKADTKSH